MPVYPRGQRAACRLINFSSTAHVDKGDSGFSIMYFVSTKECHTDTGGHLLFPEYNLKVPMKHGQIVVFDPLVCHCIEQFPGYTGDRYAASLFSKTKTLKMLEKATMHC